MKEKRPRSIYVPRITGEFATEDLLLARAQEFFLIIIEKVAPEPLLEDFERSPMSERAGEEIDVDPSSIERGSSRPIRSVFAAMPFAAQYDDVYFVAMAHAAAQVNAVCRRVDHEEFDGDIVSRIETMIRSSAAVIADPSESKPNVLYETGFAHALDRPTVHICSTPLNELPFDIRNWNTIGYEKGQTFKLREPLLKRLKAALHRC